MFNLFMAANRGGHVGILYVIEFTSNASEYIAICFF